jgi:group I intron endonuclease
MKTGVYQIKNLVNGKVYVGSAVNINHRWVEHKSDLSRQKHHSKHLQYAWNKYGESNFNFEILEECPVEKLIYWEQIWMDSLCACDKRLGYNISPIAGSCLGVKHSEKAKKNMSDSHRGISGGENNPAAKLTWEKVREIREKYASGKHTQRSLAKDKGIAHSGIVNIIHNETWVDETLSDDYLEKVIKVGIENRSSDEIRAKMSFSRRGEKSSLAKLSWEKVRAIRSKYLTGKYVYEDLAKEYEVGRSCIGSIVGNRTWRDESLGSEYFTKITELMSGHEKKNLSAKLTWKIVQAIREKYLTGKYSQSELAREYGVIQQTIGKIVLNKRWKEENNVEKN